MKPIILRGSLISGRQGGEPGIDSPRPMLWIPGSPHPI